MTLFPSTGQVGLTFHNFRRFNQLGSRWPKWFCVFNLLHPSMSNRKGTLAYFDPVTKLLWSQSWGTAGRKPESFPTTSPSRQKQRLADRQRAWSRASIRGGLGHWFRNKSCLPPFPGTFQTFIYPSMSWSKAVTHLIIYFSAAPPSKAGLRVTSLELKCKIVMEN